MIEFNKSFYTTLMLVLIAQLFIISESKTETLSSVNLKSNAAVASKTVRVPKIPSDSKIQQRLLKISATTDWYKDINIEVKEGIVFLSGKLDSAEHKEWLENMAKSTEGVIAVINNIEKPQTDFDLTPANRELETLWKKFIQSMPYILASVLVLILSAIIAMFSAKGIRRLLTGRIRNRQLIYYLSNVMVVPVIVLGFYLVLRISGLTQLALTVLGGTGLIGLIFGFAAKGILENYFTSLMITFRNTIEEGDLIEINDIKGFVVQTDSSTTVLKDFNNSSILIHIPNSKIYDSIVKNYSSSPKEKYAFNFRVPLGSNYGTIRTLILQYLAKNSSIELNPTPTVTIDSLGSSTAEISVSFWLNTKRFVSSQVKSDIIEAVLRILKQNDIHVTNDLQEIYLKAPLESNIINSHFMPHQLKQINSEGGSYEKNNN